jgi:hypothetical protein
MRKLGKSTGEVRGARGSRWIVHYQWAAIGGRAEVVELTLRSLDDPPVPVTTTVLRSLNLGSEIDQSRAGWATAFEDLSADDPRWTAHAEPMTAPASRERRGGHPQTTDAELAEVARVYRQALAEGRPPTQAVAKARLLSLSGAAKRVRRARDRGFLPETTAGVAAADTPAPRRRRKSTNKEQS